MSMFIQSSTPLECQEAYRQAHQTLMDKTRLGQTKAAIMASILKLVEVMGIVNDNTGKLSVTKKAVKLGLRNRNFNVSRSDFTIGCAVNVNDPSDVISTGQLLQRVNPAKYDEIRAVVNPEHDGVLHDVFETKISHVYEYAACYSADCPYVLADLLLNNNPSGPLSLVVPYPTA